MTLCELMHFHRPKGSQLVRTTFLPAGRWVRDISRSLHLQISTVRMTLQARRHASAQKYDLSYSTMGKDIV